MLTLCTMFVDLCPHLLTACMSLFLCELSLFLYVLTTILGRNHFLHTIAAIIEFENMFTHEITTLVRVVIDFPCWQDLIGVETLCFLANYLAWCIPSNSNNFQHLSFS